MLVRIAVLLVILVLLCLSPAAYSKEVGRLEAPGLAVIVLTDDPGGCKDGATRVQAAHVRAGLLVGCWFERMEMIWILWDNDNIAGFDKDRFKFSDI